MVYVVKGIFKKINNLRCMNYTEKKSSFFVLIQIFLNLNYKENVIYYYNDSVDAV